jgi:hypothetical protein
LDFTNLRARYINGKDLRAIGQGGMGQTDLAQVRNQWWAPVNTVMNLRIHKILGSSSVAAELVGSGKGQLHGVVH